MPYRVNSAGVRKLDQIEQGIIPYEILTDLQLKALVYLAEDRPGDPEEYTESSEIAKALGVHPQAARGVMWSLYKRGLVDKE